MVELISKDSSNDGFKRLCKMSIVFNLSSVCVD